jgi:phenylalanine-4-hydroxylase
MISLARTSRLFASSLSHWTPTSLADVPLINRQYVDFTKSLGEKYPGFTDPMYFPWLQQIRSATLNELPEQHLVNYTPDCQETWRLIYTRLRSLHFKYACDEHVQSLRDLEASGVYSERQIPQFPWINEFLRSRTGFKLVPCGGMINSRSFLNGLAFKTFFCTQYLRHKSVPFYSPEPDVVHELMGHIPLFANPDFAEFSQEIGICSLGASDETIERLAKVYFYAIEFGVIQAPNSVTVLGAGILGSCEETEFVGKKQGKLKRWVTSEVIQTEYELSEMQPFYYASSSLHDLKEQVMSYLETLPRQVHFDRVNSKASLIY